MLSVSGKPLASNRHFAIFAVICAGFTSYGIVAQNHARGSTLDAGHQGIIPLYLSTMLAEWLLVLFVWRGMRASANDPRAFVARWTSAATAALDVVIGIVFGIVLLYVDAGLSELAAANSAASVDALLPRGTIEVILWIGVSITAGITEEFVYRGYLFGQLAARLRSVPLALVAQALWFGVMHAYEGLHSVLSICVLAVAFGLMAAWRRQLRTNMIAHTLFDLIAGLAPRLIRF